VDGSGVRDYIHVMDLAIGHVKALEKLCEEKGVLIYNLGTGSGVSVLQLVHAFEKANDLTIPYKIYDRRAGDIAEFYADASKAEREMGWKATRTIEDMCRDAWNWQRQNPQGY
jgi:UDP-glucose 4-epimerase